MKRETCTHRKKIRTITDRQTKIGKNERNMKGKVVKVRKEKDTDKQ